LKVDELRQRPSEVAKGVDMAVLGLIAALVLAAGESSPPHIGHYTPNSQLLSWCKSKEIRDYDQCRTFIEAVIESTGLPDVNWPKGAIELPDGVYAHHLIPAVVRHIAGLAQEDMSKPAVRSVYHAVVAEHPYKSQPSPRGPGSK
jgi:hypothetical protein